MAELLEVLHLPDDDGVAEVDVGSGGIEADLDGERLALARCARELRFQVGFLDQIDRSLGQIFELFVRRHARRIVNC